MEQQLTIKEIKAKQQRDWYNRNKEKAKQKKKTWYQNNRERALARNKAWRESKKTEEQLLKSRGIVLKDTKPKFINTGLTYFEILDVLRKDNRHYLWGKSVKQWSEKDWFNFLELKEKFEVTLKAS
jgi:hypothetical protein